MVKRPSHLLPHLRIPYLNYSMAMQRPCGCHQARMGQNLPCLCVIPPASPSQHPRFGLSCPRVSAFHQTLRSLRREFPYGRLATPPSRYSVTCCTATKYGVKQIKRDPKRTHLVGVETQPSRSLQVLAVCIELNLNSTWIKQWQWEKSIATKCIPGYLLISEETSPSSHEPS